MKALTSDIVGKVVQSVEFDSEGVAIHFTDGTAMAFIAHMSYDSAEIEVAATIGDLDLYVAKSLDLITAAEYEQKMTDERTNSQRRQDEREREEFARLTAKYGTARG